MSFFTWSRGAPIRNWLFLARRASKKRNWKAEARETLEHRRDVALVQAPKGAVVFRQGDSASNCWLIAKGEVGLISQTMRPMRQQ